MLHTILDRYAQALEDAFDEENEALYFLHWLCALKEETFVGRAGADDACPLHTYLSLLFGYDGVVFRVTDTHVVVCRGDDEGEVVWPFATIPLPQTARRFVALVDEGGPRGPMQWGEDHCERNPPIHAGEAVRLLRLAHGFDDTDGPRGGPDMIYL